MICWESAGVDDLVTGQRFCKVLKRLIFLYGRLDVLFFSRSDVPGLVMRFTRISSI